MNAEILSVGTELLLGDIVNTNAAYIAKVLAECGIGCYYQAVVGDNPVRLKECIGNSLKRSEIVITTGGLGPTYDDLTKETVAEYFNRSMKLHQVSFDRMAAMFEKMGRTMTPNNEKQAYMPDGAIIFQNDRGTAPGLAIEEDGKIVIMLPGPPIEMVAMFEKEVKPYLLKLSHTTLVSHNIHIFGIGESAVESMLKDKMEACTNPTIAPYAKEGEVLLRVTASGEDRKQAEELIAPIIADICSMLEGYVYGVDVRSLQNALFIELKKKGLTIATAESCTGGLISKRITDISGSSEVLLGGVCAYSNMVKEKLIEVPSELLDSFGAVSEEVALAMAKGVRNVTGADIGVSTTGIAGPLGGSSDKPVGLVYVGISGPKGDKVVKLNLSRNYEDEREAIRYSASSHALHLALQYAKGM